LPYYQSSEDVSRPPDGWRLLRIDDVYEPIPKGRLYAKKECVKGGRVPVLDQSEDGIIGFHNDVCGVDASAQRPVVTFANHTCEMRWVRFPFSVIQNVFPMVGRNGVCETRYFYYCTKGRVWLEEYKGHYPDYRRAWVPVPPLDEQRRIAAVLGALDDKIELNRKMNRTLEDMAQAIFKSWFIDFDGVPPSELVDSELGPIPRGWDVFTLGDLITLDKGLSYKSKYLVPSGIPMANLKCVAPGGGFQRGGLKPYAGDYKEKHLVHPGDIVIAMTDLTQNRVVIASPALVPRVSGHDKILMSLDLTCPRPKVPTSLTNLWLYQRLKSDDFKSFARGFANGTTVMHLKMDGVQRYRFPLPPQDRIAEFTAIADDLGRRVALCTDESDILMELRDALLPKLISGEIRVPEAEKTIEAIL